MRVIRKIVFLALLLIAVLFVQTASATIEPILKSSYYEGYVFYGTEPDDGYLKGRIDFAVYDTWDPVYGNEYIDVGIEAPGDGQYIYAYQIFNDYDGVSEEAVAYFALLGIDGNTVNDIGSQEDSAEGIEPGSEYYDEDESNVIWKFDGVDGYIIAGEHSWFLVFSSDHDWVAGSYEIKGPQDVPAPGAPEPTTIALLGLGGAVLLKRQRKPV